MPFIRLLILAAVIWLIYRLARRLLPRKPAVTGRSEGTRMVRCAQCGVYVTEEDACKKNGEAYCCEDHYLKHRDDPSP